MDAWVVVTGITCWAMGWTTGWVVGHRRVPILLTQILMQREVITGLSSMQDDLVAELQRLKPGPPGVIGPKAETT